MAKVNAERASEWPPGLVETGFNPRLELHQLRCFVAVADGLHFGQAARRMNMTQPPFSRQIQQLEHGLKVKLLDRTTRVVKLTPAGRNFLPEARRILHLTESATLTTRRIAAGEAGNVTVGFTATSGYGFLPQLLLRCAAQLPNINISLKEMGSSEQRESLLTGGIDIGLFRPPIHRGEFKSLRVASERLVAALPSGDPRLAKASLAPADFHRQKLIMYTQDGSPYFHDMVAKLFHASAVSPVAVQAITPVHSMLAMVRVGIAAALVPEAAMSLHFDNVHFRPVDTDPVEPVELFAVWCGDNDNPALVPFLELPLRELDGIQQTNCC